MQFVSSPAWSTNTRSGGSRCYERVLDLVSDAGGQLPERGHLLRMDQPVLSAAQIGECGLGGSARTTRVLAARHQFLKQPRILDGEHGLPREGLQ